MQAEFPLNRAAEYGPSTCTGVRARLGGNPMSERTCFVIAPIGDPESQIRKRSDQVLKHVIGPAVASCGYRALRADQISEPGMITSQVIQHIVEDPLVVADLTDRNPNVFYELAIRHAIRRPLVQLIKKGNKSPSTSQEQERYMLTTTTWTVSKRQSKKSLPRSTRSRRTREAGNAHLRLPRPAGTPPKR